jgi:hypothetical protein
MLAGTTEPLDVVPGGLTDAGIVSLAPVMTGPTVTIGYPGDPGSGNCFPFGCSGTRYQQVYNKNLFPGPMTINNISFFNEQFTPGSINSASYTIFLSTTSKLVNQLNTVDLDDNVGPDNALFLSAPLGGPLTSTRFTLEGLAFFYDPSQGNLLIDIFKGPSSGGGIFLDARNGTFGSDSSRAHNFGSGFASFGLVTEFNSVSTPLAVNAAAQQPGVAAGADGAPVQSQ